MNKPFVIEARGTKSASPICLLSPTIANVGFQLSSELVLAPSPNTTNRHANARLIRKALVKKDG